MRQARAPGGLAQANHTKTNQPAHTKGDITLQGCVSRAAGQYILMQADPATTYKLESGKGDIKLDPHLGEQVEVTGWESPSLSTSSECLSMDGSSSSMMLMVTSIRTLEKRCSTRRDERWSFSENEHRRERVLAKTASEADVFPLTTCNNSTMLRLKIVRVFAFRVTVSAQPEPGFIAPVVCFCSLEAECPTET